MNFRLVASGWSDELDAGMRERPDTVLIVCPFIKRRTVERLIFAHRPRDLRVITRFDLNAFNAGVSDLDALDLLMQSGAKIRGVVGVHSKMYIFGDKRAIVTSANLTEAAMLQNKEFGFVAEDPFIAAQCQSYFERL